jgi:hypothetical protein
MRSPWPGWVRWAWLLPVLELVLSAAIAGPPAYRMLRNPPQLSRAANGKIVIDLRSPAVQQWLAEREPRFPSRFEDVWYLNIPADLVEIGISMPTSWPESYRPHWSWPVGLDGFRALTWPIWAIPFWLFAGRGIDSLFRGKPISVFEAFFSGLIGLCFGGLAVALAFDPGEFDEPHMRWIALPGVMWITFSLICLIAWWKQRRAKRTKQTAPLPA